MKSVLFMLLFVVLSAVCQDKKDSNEGGTGNLKQYYSGKVGFYSPAPELNDGLLIGLDGITEFTHYNFFLSLSADLYLKKTFDFFSQPKPDVVDQQIFILPLQASFGYRVFNIPDADSRGYLGIGGGYYFYFYSAEYKTSGGIFVPGSTQADTKNSGAFVGSIFARALLGKVFVEPRFFFASASSDNIGGYNFTVDPSGFAITVGFQQ